MDILCLVLKHRPNRSRIWYDGLDFRAPCRRCGTPLLQDFEQGWREFDPELDYSGRGKLRTAGPEHR